MSKYLGDFLEDSTVYVYVTTNNGSGGAVAPSSAFEAADFDIYKDGGTSEKTTDNGLTISSPFDTVTGLHLLTIDTSNDTGDAGFWAAGSDYTVILNPDETVDSETVVGVVATFSIENRNNEVNVVQVSGDSTAADNLEADYDGTGYAKTNSTVGTATSVTNQVTANMTAISGDSVAADNLESDYDGTGYAKTASTIGTVTDVTNEVDADVTAISGDATAANNLEADYDGTGYTKTNSTIGTCTVNTDMRGTDSAMLASSLGTLVDLGDGSTTLAQQFTALAGSSANAGSYSRSTDSLEAIRDRGDGAWTTGAGGSDRLLMVDTTIATLASQTSFTLAGGSSDDDAYNGCTIVIEDASTSAQKAVGIVDDYTGSTKTVTLLYDPAVFTMATSDKVYVLAERGVKSQTRDDYHLDINSSGEVATSGGGGGGTDVGLIHSGTAQAGANGSIDLEATITGISDDDPAFTSLIYITAGTGKGQARLCTGFTASNQRATVGPNWSTNPDNTSEYQWISLTISNLVSIYQDEGAADDASDFFNNAYDSAANRVRAYMFGINGEAFTETTASRLADNFSTFYDNGDADTAKIVDDVGDVLSISGDTTAADNLELDYDGTGYAKTNSTIGTATTVTNQVTANVTAVSGDTTAADNLEADYDGTGYAKTASTVGTVTDVTNQVDADVTSISGDSTAADNLESDYDGTGYAKTNSTIGTVTAVSTAGEQSIADEVLSRNVSNVEGTMPEHCLGTTILGQLESSRSGTTWTIKRTNGTTTHVTKTITVDAGASPVTGVE